MDPFQQTLTVNNFIEAISAKDRAGVVAVNFLAIIQWLEIFDSRPGLL